MGKEKQVTGGGGRPFRSGFRKGSARAQHQAKKSLTRKEVRKAERQERKAKKHEFFLIKSGVKAHPVAETPEKSRRREKQRKKRREKLKALESKGQGDRNDKSEEESEDEEEEKFPPPPTVPPTGPSIPVIDALKLKEQERELASQMKDVRKKRLLEENEEEEKYIKMLSKRLKLNKTAKVPASFKEDGLDYLLEICDTGASKKKSKDKPKGTEENLDDSDGCEDLDEAGDFDGSDEEGDGDDHESGVEDSDSGNEEENFQDDESSNSETSEGMPDDDIRDGSSGSESEEEPKAKEKIKNSGIWEDIYGRMRDKEGKVLDDAKVSHPNKDVKSAEVDKVSSTTKYVPPMRRENQTNRDKIKKSLKGLLNRLAESNMHSIVGQIEDMYMKNSRNEMNESILELYSDALIKPVLMPERIMLEHIMVIAILHANVGTEVGAFFIQNFIGKFHGMYAELNGGETDKKLENLGLLASFMYHFKIVDCGLMYDLLNFLTEKFTGKDVELILTILKSIGFRLRKDNPIALKSLILTLQQKASATKSTDTSSRVKFMLEIILAIRNNNMNKIPNYDPSYGEHLLKIIKSHLHKGNYVSEMKISMQDLLNAETKGRWWIVGSAWTNNIAGKDADHPLDKTLEESKEILKLKETNEKLLEKARTLGMNTDTRRDIFCILMSAEDYLDAFEKLMRLGLKNQVERDIVHVIIYCSLQEKKFNPFYAFLASKLCQTERRFMLTTQYSLWDRLKDLKSNPGFQLTNLSRFIVHLINEKSLPLSLLKILDFADMDKNKLKFLKKTLAGVLLNDNIETLEEVFAKTATSENLNIFRESLKLFLNHFLLKGEKEVVCLSGGTVDMSFDPVTLEKLKARVRIAERSMSLGQSRVKF